MKRTFTKRPVLASQARGTVNTFRNNRNSNKYIEVKKGNDGHSYARQYMEWDTPDGKVKNYTGARDPKRGRYHRARRSTIDQMLEDYTPYVDDGADVTASSNITNIQDRIDQLYENLARCTDDDCRIDIQLEIDELEDELRFAWAEDEAAYNYAHEMQEFNPDGSLKYY